jgi:hypothetical protein
MSAVTTRNLVGNVAGHPCTIVLKKNETTYFEIFSQLGLQESTSMLDVTVEISSISEHKYFYSVLWFKKGGQLQIFEFGKPMQDISKTEVISQNVFLFAQRILVGRVDRLTIEEQNKETKARTKAFIDQLDGIKEKRP